MDIFGAIGAINALLLAFFLFKEKSKTTSDKVLIAWVINFTLYFGCYFLFERFTNSINILMLPVWGISMISHPIFLFVYTLSLSKNRFVINYKIGSNFVIVFFGLMLYIPFILLTPEEQHQLIYSKQSIGFEIFLPMIGQFCIEIFYFIRTLIVLIKHQQNIDQEFSCHDKIKLSWLKLLTSLYIVILVSNIVGYSVASSKVLNVKVIDDILMIVRFILFFYMIYKGYKQRLIYKPDIKEHSHKSKKSEKVSLKQSSTEESYLSDLEHKETIEKLRMLMVDKKLFLEPELSLGETAIELGIHAHQLTKLLNNHLGQNFYDFVNEYRVDEFKRLAVKPENKHFSLLGLAMEAGFNSKATFNRFFKKNTGLTPSEFRNKH